MEKVFQFGIIGAGNIAKRFCDAVRMVDHARVSAVASRTPGKGERFAEENGIETVCRTYEELVCRKEIDAVYIATTHNFHYENILLALNHGKHVLCEKAMVLTKAQAEEVFALAREKRLVCMEAMWSRFLPAVQQARKWAQSGRLGEIEMANCVIGFRCDPDPKGRILNPDLAGGALYDIGVYAIELMNYLIPQKLEKISSQLTKTVQGVDKVDCITLGYENCVAGLQLTISAGVESTLNIYGTKGRIRIPEPIFADTCELYDDKGLAEKFFQRRENGFEYEVAELIRCAESGEMESPVIPHADTVLCAEIFDRCMEDNR